MDKKIILGLIVLLVVFLNNIAYSQSGWIQQNSGTTSHLLEVFFINADTGWCCGTYGKILKTIDGGDNWNSQTSGTTELLGGIFFINSDTGWIAGREGNLFYTENGGDEWNVQFVAESINDVFFINDTIGWICGPAHPSVFKTVDSGINWVAPDTSYTSSSFDFIQFIDENTGFGGSSMGISKTTNGGRSWTPCDVYINCHSFYFLNDTHGWAVGSTPQAMKTINGGESWTLFDDERFGRLHDVYFLDENIGWAVGDNGTIFKTTSNGEEGWQLQATSVEGMLFSVYFFDTSTGWVIGEGGIILKTTTGGTTSIQENTREHDTPIQYSLSQNFPNPFNPSTTIYYRLPKSGNVKLNIYDLLGQEIVSLVNSYQTAGEHEITWQPKGLSSGIYFYRLHAGEYAETKKLILHK